MEVSILSREMIKPSSTLNIQRQPPLKLNLLDQLTPSSYSPLILFYQNNNNQTNISHISKQLKCSLSKTISLHYPVSGRVRDNFVIDNFCEGVPFIEARVNCSLCDFLNNQDNDSTNHGVELLNNLLPLQVQRLVLDDTGPQVVVQLNRFECGGLALGFCSLHKTIDGVAARGLLRTWSTLNNGQLGDNQMVEPDFSEGHSTFPPMRSIPPHYTSLTRSLWFGKSKLGKPVTRRFVFDAESISMLRAKAKSENLENPTRAEALSAFLWKSIMMNNEKNDYKSSILSQTVDLRRLTRPRLSRHSYGNSILFTDSVYDPKIHGEPPGMEVLAELARNGVSKIDREFVKRISGENGSRAIFEYFDRQAESENEEMDVLNVACLHGLGMGKIDFGWGPTVWVALGGPGSGSGENDMPFMFDTATLVDNNKGGLEAWLNLKEPEEMRALESNMEFLDFVSTKSTILP
ncbi:Stemmadenine O-acetyltransferase [Linum perenne]